MRMQFNEELHHYLHHNHDKNLRLRQRKTLKDALLMTKDDFGKTFRRSASYHQLANYRPTDDGAERRNVLPKSSFVINKASSSVFLCLNHNHEGVIEKVV